MDEDKRLLGPSDGWPSRRLLEFMHGKAYCDQYPDIDDLCAALKKKAAEQEEADKKRMSDPESIGMMRMKFEFDYRTEKEAEQMLDKVRNFERIHKLEVSNSLGWHKMINDMDKDDQK